MTWEREVLGQSAEHLVRCNSPELLAHLLHGAAQRLLEQAERHRADEARWRAAMGTYERAGREVYRARAAGRKTVRVADVTEDPEAPGA